MGPDKAASRPLEDASADEAMNGGLRVLWKMLRGDTETPTSHYDDSPWVVGEWRDAGEEFKSKCGTEEAPYVEACEFGFHACPSLVEAFMYVEPGVIALVEVGGEWDDDDDEGSDYDDDEDYIFAAKSAHERMRLVRVWEWNEEDYQALAEEIGRYENEHGCGGRYLSYPEIVAQFAGEWRVTRWQGICSYAIERRLPRAEWDHLSKWWERRLLGNAAE